MSLLINRQLSMQKCQAFQARPCVVRPSMRSVAAAAAPKETPRMDKVSGYIEADNSGKGNMYPTLQKPFVSSPTTAAAAGQGLGGLPGVAVLAAVLGVVAVATVGVSQNPGTESVAQVASALGSDSLSAIADRIAATL